MPAGLRLYATLADLVRQWLMIVPIERNSRSFECNLPRILRKSEQFLRAEALFDGRDLDVRLTN